MHKGISQGGINLSSMFYQLWPSCLSTDEIFQSFEYKDLCESYKEEKALYENILKAKNIEVKAKALLSKE